MSTIRAIVVFALLIVLRTVSRIFFRHEVFWVGEPLSSWSRVRILVGLNHTSLYEPLYAGALSVPLLWRIARHGVVPLADKTSRRPLVGLFFKFLAQDVVSVTRKDDHTWEKVLAKVDPQSIVVVFPEGRMKRADGLDAEGRPMTVRGGIADILSAVPSGKMLIGYSGGLHHVQVPGQLLPRLFRTLRLGFEAVDIPGYRADILSRTDASGFKRAVVEDLQERRDLHCREVVPDAADAR
jgi:1-acyl-sn-glycerol-3-phosphate acyltransferase